MLVPDPVYVNDSTTQEVKEQGLIDDAMAYWKGDGAQYFSYEAEFHFTEADYNSGMSFFFVEDIHDHVEECGTTAIGFTVPQEHGPVEMYVGPCENRANTLSNFKHEFGNYLGFQNGDESKPLMDPVSLNCSSWQTSTIAGTYRSSVRFAS